MRLSYFERVTRVFSTDPSGASDMTSLMPPQPQPCFKYDSMDKARKRAENDRIASGGAQGTAASNVDVEMDAMDASSYEQDPRLVAFADRFLECLRLKQPLHELQAVVTEMAAYAGTLGGTLKHGDEPLDGMPLAREITVQCVLFLGSKSFSHTLNVMERHLALLKWVAPTPEAKLHLLQVVASFWQTNKQV